MATLSSSLDWRNSMNRGAWRATVPGVTKSRTRLRDQQFHAFIFMVIKLGLK